MRHGHFSGGCEEQRCYTSTVKFRISVGPRRDTFPSVRKSDDTYFCWRRLKVSNLNNVIILFECSITTAYPDRNDHSDIFPRQLETSCSPIVKQPIYFLTQITSKRISIRVTYRVISLKDPHIKNEDIFKNEKENGNVPTRASAPASRRLLRYPRSGRMKENLQGSARCKNRRETYARCGEKSAVSMHQSRTRYRGC